MNAAPALSSTATAVYYVIIQREIKQVEVNTVSVCICFKTGAQKKCGEAVEAGVEKQGHLCEGWPAFGRHGLPAAQGIHRHFESSSQLRTAEQCARY